MIGSLDRINGAWILRSDVFLTTADAGLNKIMSHFAEQFSSSGNGFDSSSAGAHFDSPLGHLTILTEVCYSSLALFFEEDTGTVPRYFQIQRTFSSSHII